MRAVLQGTALVAAVVLAWASQPRAGCAEPAGPAVSGGQSHLSDQRRYLLEVRKSQVELEEARADLDRATRLAQQGLVSQTEAERAKTAYEHAEINFQEALLSLLNVQPRISVERAIKRQSRDGKRFVSLTVKNETPGLSEVDLQSLGAGTAAIPIPEAFRNRTVRDIFLSLKGTGEGTTLKEGTQRGTTVALPYEQRIAELGYGAAATLEFRLIRDVESVVVAISFGGEQREIDVQLEQAETEQALEVSSTQISQEADLGSQATYELRLERSSVDEDNFQLKVLNLPRQVTYAFVDAAGEARLSQISFPAGVTDRKLGLRVFLPERPGGALALDRPLKFWALVLSPQRAAAFDQDRDFTAAEIDAAHAGRVQLEVIPRGTGKIAVEAPTLFTEIDKGGSAHVDLGVRNTGTRALDNVEVQADAPAGWRVAVSPATVAELQVGELRQVRIAATPPPSVPVGDYEIRLRTESFAFNRRVPSEDKIYRVSVRGGSSLGLTFGLLSVLCALVGGVAVVVVRATRR